jgi:5'-deoxynucleotidase YfbR-like HD superfamily hydrolase
MTSSNQNYQFCEFKYDQQEKREILKEADELDLYYKRLDELQAKKIKK